MKNQSARLVAGAARGITSTAVLLLIGMTASTVMAKDLIQKTSNLSVSGVAVSEPRPGDLVSFYSAPV